MDSRSNRGGEPLARIGFIDRLAVLVAHPKRLIVAIVALLVAAGAAVGSSAVLTSSSTNPGNSFSASNLSVTNDVNGVLMNVTGLLPGESTTPPSPITITNNGDLPGLMSLSVSPSDTPGPNAGALSSVLNATITDTTASTVVYSGPAASMPPQQLDFDASTPLTQDPFPAGQSHSYTVQLSFPNGGPPASNTTGDNAYQQSSTTFRYDWKATQTP